MEGNIHKLRWSPDRGEERKKTRERPVARENGRLPSSLARLLQIGVDWCGIETHRVSSSVKSEHYVEESKIKSHCYR